MGFEKLQFPDRQFLRKKRQGLLWLSDYTTFPKSSESPVESIHTKKESAASMLARLS
jgi:hypothetical protein